MNFRSFSNQLFGLSLSLTLSVSAFAAASKMAILSAAQSVPMNSCSGAVHAQAQNNKSVPVTMTKAMKVYFTGSSKNLKFYSDPGCTKQVSDITMAAGTHTVQFYFRGAAIGRQKLVIATYNLEDTEQYETILAVGTPTPTPTTTPTVTPTVTPTTTPTPTPTSGQIPSPLYGVTTDSIGNLSGIVQSLQTMPHKPTTRIVFDEYVPATNYTQAVNQISNVSYVMGELLDSFYVKRYSVDEYKNRVTEYLNALGNKVDLWEIGNEVNGEWLGDTPTVVTKIYNAYQQVKARGFKTELTLYYNQGCWEKSQNEMFTWAQNNIPADMKQGLDYVLVSFYEDDCNGLQPNWQAVFDRLGTLFPNSKIGMGEVGTQTAAAKAGYIQKYYGMKINHPRYVGGHFWWYFHQDMVPANAPLLDVLNNAIR
jgi:hypothetical protein